MWLAANNVLGARWRIVLPAKLGPKPNVPTAMTPTEGKKSGILNTKNRSAGILSRSRVGTPLNRRPTSLGNFRFLPEITAQPILSPTEQITSKAPRDYNTFVTIKTAPLDEGGAVGEKFVVDQIHRVLEILWSVDSTLVLYPFPGKIQHSKYTMPYKQKHTSTRTRSEERRG